VNSDTWCNQQEQATHTINVYETQIAKTYPPLEHPVCTREDSILNQTEAGRNVLFTVKGIWINAPCSIVKFPSGSAHMAAVWLTCDKETPITRSLSGTVAALCNSK